MGKISFDPGSGLSILLAAVAIAVTTNTIPAQSAPVPIFENVSIGTNFSPNPMSVRGISGGKVPAKQVVGRSDTANGPCVGFVDDKPDHTLVLKNSFNKLKLQVQSSQDTTLIVRGPGGVWCNDDLDGKNPGISGEWLPGSYSVWVGSYNQTKFVPYTLQISSH